MSKTSYLNHPSFPGAQAFNGKGIRNKTKKNSWWAVGSTTHWASRKKKSNEA